MKDWRPSTWGEEIALEYGKALRNYSTGESGAYRVYGSNGAIGWTDVPLTSGPGVVLGRKGAYRGVQYSVAPFFVIDTAYYVVPKAELDMRWLYYAITFYRLGEIDDGSPIPSTTRAAVYVRELRVPPIEEQKAISFVLGAIDDKIELNRRTNQTLEATARAVFKDWLVDFGPVRAKCESCEPYLAPDAWELFPDQFGVDGLPIGWTRLPLDKAADFLNGLALQKFPPTGASDLPVIRIADLRAGAARGDALASGNLPSQYIIDDGDVIFSWSGSLLQRIWTGGRGALNQHLFKVTSERFPKWFHYLWVDYHLPEFQRIAAAKATTMGHIQRHHLTAAAVVVPTEPVLEAANAVLAPILEAIVRNDVESRELGAVRNLLLPKLISGDLRIKDAERFIEEATA